MSTEGQLGLIERIVDFSGRRKWLILLAALALTLAGGFLVQQTPLDALPDLSDTQVIIATEWMGRSPTLIEDQVTYPLATTMLGTPKVKTVRGFTMLGMSFVYVVFQDGTDVYWARSRVLEQLSKVRGKLPAGVEPQIGPDATSVGWVYQYVLTDPGHKYAPWQLRAVQDWHLRYELQGLDGVSEVATVGGFEKQWLVEADPAKLQAFGVTIGEVAAAVRGSNGEVGGRIVEMAAHEYAIRGRGYVESAEDIAKAVVSSSGTGTPVRVADVATVSIGPNLRRGTADLDGRGDVVGGIVVMRTGANALDVIDRVKTRIESIKSSLPAGIEIVPVYDRSSVIRASVKTLTDNVLEIIAIIVLVIGLFLFHFRSALVAAIALPIATISTFIVFWALDLTINIMSLAGVILALGDMVDSAVVLVENAHKRIAAAEKNGDKTSRTDLVIGAARELGPTMFGALLVLTIAFLPVFTLQGEEGRLFRPLALAKTFAMAFASLFSITLVPALMVVLLRGKIRPEEKNPLNRLAVALYRPILAFCLRFRWLVIALALALAGATVWPFLQLGSEFMPPLYEGDLLFMPISVPSMPIEEARQLLRKQDAAIKQVPEVARVFGKAGRAETALDPAPLSMFETIVQLKPQEQWRPGLTVEALTAELDKAAASVGVQGAWTMPIKARVDMLATGIRTPVGIKVFGPNLQTIAQVNDQLEAALRPVRGTRSVYAERELGGFFLDITPDREAIARYGLRMRDVLDSIETALGGMEVTQTFEGRERYTVAVRYPRDGRGDLEAIRRIRVPIPMQNSRIPQSPTRGGAMTAATPQEGAGQAMGAMGASAGGMGDSGVASALAAMPPDNSMGSGMATGAQATSGQNPQARQAFVPLEQIAKITTVMGPPMIKSEMGKLTGWVYVDLQDRDVGGYVDDAKAAVAKHVKLPPGVTLKWTGQYENLERVRARMAWLLPLTILMVFAILYIQFRGAIQALIVLSGVPFAAVGAIWLLWAMQFRTSIAVWVGMIGLLGVAAETASVMVAYLDEAWVAGRAAGTLKTLEQLIPAAVEAGSQRVRPLLMTVMTNILGLLPVLLDSGVGADVAKRIAAPMWGGLVSLTALTLLVVPAMYVVWRSGQLRRLERGSHA
jgi:Cu(I)/Ag(I) efflux system membrane protein CusA/SilA